MKVVKVAVLVIRDEGGCVCNVKHIGRICVIKGGNKFVRLVLIHQVKRKCKKLIHKIGLISR
jgi:hypothetical protein